MRILVHDFGGYAFPYSLSKELASRGYEVHHAYCASLLTTPPGIPILPEGQTPIPFLHPISLPGSLNKYNFVQRWRQERTYGKLIVDAVKRIKPNVVLSANTPLDAQKALQSYCKKEQIKFIFWLQDLIGIATDDILRTKIPILGAVIGQHYIKMEKKLLQQSDHVITISPSFETLLDNWNIVPSKKTTIPNWAPLEIFPQKNKLNNWSKAHGLTNKFVFLYAGTLGMKHNPDLLLQLARENRHHRDVRVIVISQGKGADWLNEKKTIEDLENLVVLPFQPKTQLPEVLAAADVLVALLEPSASSYSVPSKVLTYMCAGRAMLLAVPLENQAAQLVSMHNLGTVTPPNNPTLFMEKAKTMLESKEICAAQGERARQQAEQMFSIVKITDHFETILSRMM